MYHAIVRRRVVDLFRSVSSGDAEPVLRTFAPRFEHTFLGESALGGTRRTLSATRQWYERLYRLLPDIKFDLKDILVSGGPSGAASYLATLATHGAERVVVTLAAGGWVRQVELLAEARDLLAE